MAQSLDISENQIKISLENEIRSLKAKYAVEKKMRGFPDPQIIQNAYNESISSAKNIEEFNASHILVESEEKALEILQLLDAGAEFSKSGLIFCLNLFEFEGMTLAKSGLGRPSRYSLGQHMT